MYAPNDFRPWDAHYRASCVHLMVGLTCGWGCQLTGHPHWATLLSAVGTYYGWKQYARGRPREFGIEVEHQAVADLTRHLEPRGYVIRPNIMLTKGGNIDAIVRAPGESINFVVEIKSYKGLVKRWWGSLTKIDRFYPLLKEPRQVRFQCSALGATNHFPVLWCPISSRNNVAAYRDILLVNGDVNTLRFGLDWYVKNVSLPVSVSFPRMPPTEYRNELKRRGFVWYSVRRMWHGRTTLQVAWLLAETMARVGGRVLLRR